MPVPTLIPPPPGNSTEIRSASTELLNSENLREFRDLVREAADERISLLQEIASAEREAETARTRYTSWDQGLILKRAFKKSFGLRKEAHETASGKLDELREQLRLTAVVTEISIEPEQAEPYYRLRDEFSALSESKTIWDTLSREAINRVTTRSAANEAITREPVRFTLSKCDLLSWSEKVPQMQNRNGGDLFIYPGFILYRASRESFAVLDGRDVEVTYRPIRFIEADPIPPDSQIVGHAWAKANKDGSPDRRFANNYQIPIALYGGLILKSSSGLHEEYQCSNSTLAERFARAWTLFRSSITS